MVVVSTHSAQLENKYVNCVISFHSHSRGKIQSGLRIRSYFRKI